MKSFSFIKTVPLFVFSLFMVVSAVQRTITISGTVVDSVTGLPVQDAIVLLFDTQSLNIDTSNLSTLPFDTAFTAANGTFSRTITAPQTNLILVYAVTKTGYSLYYSGTALLSTTVNLGTIKIVPNALAPKDTIMVSGKVVDSATGLGISGALVGLSGGDLDTVGKTAITTSDGTFSRQVIINKVGSLTIVGYIAYNAGYNPALGQKTATGKTVDLGTITLSANTHVRWNRQPVRSLSINATGMSVYSLNGRLLYTGPIASPGRIARQSSGTVLVDLRNNGMSVGKKKIVPVR
jgi:hypothetical protein